MPEVTCSEQLLNADSIMRSDRVRLQETLARNCRNFTASKEMSAVQLCVFNPLAVVPAKVSIAEILLGALNSSSIG